MPTSSEKTFKSIGGRCFHLVFAAAIGVPSSKSVCRPRRCSLEADDSRRARRITTGPRSARAANSTQVTTDHRGPNCNPSLAFARRRRHASSGKLSHVRQVLGSRIIAVRAMRRWPCRQRPRCFSRPKAHDDGDSREMLSNRRHQESNGCPHSIEPHRHESELAAVTFQWNGRATIGRRIATTRVGIGKLSIDPCLRISHHCHDDQRNHTRNYRCGFHRPCSFEIRMSKTHGSRSVGPSPADECESTLATSVRPATRLHGF